MDALPLLKELVVQLAWEQPVHDDAVGHVSEQAQVRVRALGLLDDHLLEVQDDSHGGDRRVGQHAAHPVEAHQQVFQRRVNLVGWKRDAHHRLEHGARNAHCTPLPRVDLVEPPLRGIRER